VSANEANAPDIGRELEIDTIRQRKEVCIERWIELADAFIDWAEAVATVTGETVVDVTRRRARNVSTIGMFIEVCEGRLKVRGAVKVED
jgi:hypothetical protein